MKRKHGEEVKVRGGIMLHEFVSESGGPRGGCGDGG